MSLVIDINEYVIDNQIAVIRGILRLPKLRPVERYCLAELLKILYIFRNELIKPDEEMNQCATLTLQQLLEVNGNI